MKRTGALKRFFTLILAAVFVAECGLSAQAMNVGSDVIRLDAQSLGAKEKEKTVAAEPEANIEEENNAEENDAEERVTSAESLPNEIEPSEPPQAIPQERIVNLNPASVVANQIALEAAERAAEEIKYASNNRGMITAQQEQEEPQPDSQAAENSVPLQPQDEEQTVQYEQDTLISESYPQPGELAPQPAASAESSAPMATEPKDVDAPNELTAESHPHTEEQTQQQYAASDPAPQAAPQPAAQQTAQPKPQQQRTTTQPRTESVQRAVPQEEQTEREHSGAATVVRISPSGYVRPSEQSVPKQSAPQRQSETSAAPRESRQRQSAQSTLEAISQAIPDDDDASRETISQSVQPKVTKIAEAALQQNNLQPQQESAESWRNILVTADWLKANIKNVVIIDARTESQYNTGHIPGAINAPWTYFANMSARRGTEAWGVIWPEDTMAKRSGALGIDERKTVVAYCDAGGWGQSGWVMWVLRQSGISNVKLLQGGIGAWKESGGALAAGKVKPKTTGYRIARYLPNYIATTEEISKNPKEGGFAVIDVRTPQEYNGKTTPFPGVRLGHIPGAINIPREDFTTAKGYIKSAEEIQAMLTQHGITSDRDIVVYDTAGVRSAFVTVALRYAGFLKSRSYDAGFQAWAGNPSLPVATLAGALAEQRHAVTQIAPLSVPPTAVPKIKAVPTEPRAETQMPAANAGESQTMLAEAKSTATESNTEQRTAQSEASAQPNVVTRVPRAPRASLPSAPQQRAAAPTANQTQAASVSGVEQKIENQPAPQSARNMAPSSGVRSNDATLRQTEVKRLTGTALFGTAIDHKPADDSTAALTATLMSKPSDRYRQPLTEPTMNSANRANRSTIAVPASRQNNLQQMETKQEDWKNILVTADWLMANISEVVTIDARTESQYLNGHIPGALNAPWTYFANMNAKRGTEAWGAIWPEEAMSKRIGALGIDGGKTVVAYCDTGGWGQSGWVLWVLRQSGVSDVRFLQGGISAWKEAGGALANDIVKANATDYTIAKYLPNYIATTGEISGNSKDGFAVIDVRTQSEYNGTTAPIPNMRLGHIPGAINIPREYFITENGYFKSPEEIQTMMAECGITPDREIIVYDTAGVRSAFVTVVLRYAGFLKSRSYDAGFQAWAGNPNLQVVKPRTPSGRKASTSL